MNLKPTLLATSLFSTAAVLGIAQPALAQEPAPADESAVEELVVTGSRIRRSEFNSPDPVQIISAEQGALKGVADTAGLLRSATVVSGSPQVSPQVSSSFVLGRRPRRPDSVAARPRRQPHPGAGQRPAHRPGRHARPGLGRRPQRHPAVGRLEHRDPEGWRLVK